MKKILVLTFVLALVAAIVVPLAVSAAPPSGNTTINGSIASVAEINAPGGFTLGTGTPPEMALGSNTYTATSGSVTDNNASGFYVRVSSDTPDGKMTTGTVKLTNPLSVTTGSLTAVTVTTSAQTCVFSSVPAALSIPLSVSQTITTSDAAGSYSIILTYTLTENP